MTNSSRFLIIDKTIATDFLYEILTNRPGIEGLAQGTAPTRLSMLNQGELIRIRH